MSSRSAAPTRSKIDERGCGRADRIYIIGSLAGAGNINPRIINRKELHLHGVHVGSREMFAAMNRAVSLAKLRPPIDRVFSFAEAKQAYAYQATSGHFGKIVIKVDYSEPALA